MGAHFDDGFPDHPKHENLSNDATALWVRVGCYCNAKMTDGVFSETTARRLARVRAPARVIAELLKAGLWERLADGYVMHDFLDWNPSRAQRLAALEAAKERKRRWKEARSGSPTTPKETPGERVPDASPSRPRNALPSQAKPSQAKPSQDLPTGDLDQEDLPAGAPPAITPESAPRPRSRVAKAKPTPKPAPHPRFAEVVAAYAVAFEGARGQKPLLGAREGADVNRLLVRFGGDADRAIACIRAAYADTFKARNATITTIAADPSKYIGADAPSQPDGRRPIQETSDAWSPKTVEEANLPPRAAGDALGF